VTEHDSHTCFHLNCPKTVRLTAHIIGPGKPLFFLLNKLGTLELLAKLLPDFTTRPPNIALYQKKGIQPVTTEKKISSSVSLGVPKTRGPWGHNLHHFWLNKENFNCQAFSHKQFDIPFNPLMHDCIKSYISKNIYL